MFKERVRLFFDYARLRQERFPLLDHTHSNSSYAEIGLFISILRRRLNYHGPVIEHTADDLRQDHGLAAYRRENEI